MTNQDCKNLEKSKDFSCRIYQGACNCEDDCPNYCKSEVIVRDYKKLFSSGNKAQLEKLEENEHKRGFEDITFEYAYNRLLDEMIELKEAFEADVSNEGFKNLRKEAADVANFAHMIIYKCDQELK